MNGRVDYQGSLLTVLRLRVHELCPTERWSFLAALLQQVLSYLSPAVVRIAVTQGNIRRLLFHDSAVNVSLLVRRGPVALLFGVVFLSHMVGGRSLGLRLLLLS